MVLFAPFNILARGCRRSRTPLSVVIDEAFRCLGVRRNAPPVRSGPCVRQGVGCGRSPALPARCCSGALALVPDASAFASSTIAWRCELRCFASEIEKTDGIKIQRSFGPLPPFGDIDGLCGEEVIGAAFFCTASVGVISVHQPVKLLGVSICCGPINGVRCAPGKAVKRVRGARKG